MLYAVVLWAIGVLPLHALCQNFVLPEDVAQAYSLTASTTLAFPSATASISDTDAFAVSNWGLSKGRIQNQPQDLQFVANPFPNSSVPGDSTSESSSSPSLSVLYPANSFSHATGGTQFYSLFNGTSPFQSMLLSYEVAFDQDFNWVQGGKLPGIRGGPDPNGCSGGSKPNGTDCFSMRVMWRPNGVGEIYAYIPTPNNICSEEGFICNPDFGISIQRGAFFFQSGGWNKVAMLVLLNSPTNVANGYVQLYFNNVPIITQPNLQIRQSDVINAGGLYFSTFFGGNDTSWATPTDQHTYFRNVQLWARTTPSNFTGSVASAVGWRQYHKNAVVLAILACFGILL